MTDADPDRPEPAPMRLWRFGDASLDEARRELRVGGTLRALEAKPLAILVELLRRAGEVATKAELLSAVWSVNVVDGSVPTAIAKLRAALDDDNRTLIASVPRVGYRIGVPVTVSDAAVPRRIGIALRPGDPVPGRPDRRLERPLGTGNACWLVSGPTTAERAVIRFAETADGLGRLRAEWRAAEALSALGERTDLERARAHDFTSRPFLLEAPFRGTALARMSPDDRPDAARIATVATVARALDAAHRIGVLHGGVSPATILLPVDANDGTACLVGFGRHTDGREAGPWTAPELAGGGPPTVAADLYALGVVLYGAAIGDHRRPLANGWEHDVVDPVLAADIAAATAGDPARRLGSAALLADRLERLDARRAERQRDDALADAARALARRIERDRARRPWLVAAVAALVIGLGGTTATGVRAIRERDAARRQVRITAAVDTFLTEDLLGRGNPLRSGQADETLMEAARHAEPAIALRLRREPLLAASLYRAMALAFDGRSALGPARDAYARAVAAYEAAQGPSSDDATLLRLRWALMEALSTGQDGRIRARRLLADAAASLARPGPRQAEMMAWAIETRAAVAMVDNDLPTARRLARDAAERADAIPEAIDPGTRLLFREREAITEIRSGDLVPAGTLLGQLAGQALALGGPDWPGTLVVAVDRLRLLVSRNDNAAAASLGAGLCPRVAAVFGPAAHQATICLIERASAETQIGRYAAAVRDEDAVHGVLVAQGGPRDYLGLVALVNGGTAACRGGDLPGGLSRLRAALSGMRDMFGTGSPAAEIVAVQTGVCFALGRQYAAADALFELIDPAVADRASDRPDTAATIALARAAEAIDAGDASAARVRLRTPERVFHAAGGDLFLSNWTARLERRLPLDKTLISTGK